MRQIGAAEGLGPGRKIEPRLSDPRPVSHASVTAEAAVDPAGAVCVDLDGTLIRSDLLWESLAQLAREWPADALLRAPGWLTGGKAAFKAALASRVQPDPRTLPYRPEVLAYLEEAKRDGRRLVLASASNVALTELVSEHLGLFDDVIASDSEHNISGKRKLQAIHDRLGDAPFEYLGNASVDLAVWAGAERVTLVAPTRGASRGVAALGRPSETLAPSDPILRPMLRALRPNQWAKNALLFVPLLLAHELSSLSRLLDVVISFVCFCAVASAGYVLNDLLDIEADRLHRTKRNRPIASGALPIPAAVAMMAALVIGAFASSTVLLSPDCVLMLAAYLALTLSYSFYFKQRLLLDVLVLAGLYTHRVLTGGVAADVPVSPWLLAFSTFFFLSLALVKRYVELLEAQQQEKESLRRRAYQVGDLSIVETMGLSAAYISVLVLCLFVSSDDVTTLYRTPEILWLMCPVMLYWISRIWLLARRGDLHEDPVLFATTDASSYLAGALIFAVVLAASW
jgi:4-hydroxybenzoate polyprenyltransferase